VRLRDANCNANRNCGTYHCTSVSYRHTQRHTDSHGYCNDIRDCYGHHLIHVNNYG
jgi:hypothetical protein